jgi:PAS domain S-box-containing protein
MEKSLHHILCEALRETATSDKWPAPALETDRAVSEFLGAAAPQTTALWAFLKSLGNLSAAVQFMLSWKSQALSLLVGPSEDGIAGAVDVMQLIELDRHFDRWIAALAGEPTPVEFDALVRAYASFGDIGLFSLDPNHRIVQWDRNMEELYEISAEEVLGRRLEDVFEVFRGEERRFVEEVDAALSTGQVRELRNAPHLSKKKGRRIINFHMLPYRDGSGNTVVHVLVHDITDHVKQRQELDEYRRYVENILRDAADAIIVLDAEDRIRMWNRGAEALYGWKAEEVLGKPITVIVPDDPKSIEQIRWISQEVRKKGFVRNLEAQRRTRDGRIVQISVTRTAIYDENGRYVGSSVIARNITEQKRMEQQLIQSEKLSAVGKLAAGIAHEVATPLTSVSSLAQLLHELTNDPDFKEKLKLIQNETERIARTVRELVNFSRPIDHDIAAVSLNEVVRDAARIVRFDRRIKRKRLKLELEPDLPNLRASYDRLLQVVINLLLNAADALEKRPDGQIWVRTRYANGAVQLEVEDNGEGIPPENISRIFEPFFTTKKEGKGTGLGLWVCYNIVKGYAGEIEVESRPGKGSRFVVTLPVENDRG